MRTVKVVYKHSRT